jgi:P-type Cu+ transporter
MERLVSLPERSQHCGRSDHPPDQPRNTRSVQPVVALKQHYFCPMCPAVESDKPGDCPKCGMRLERNRAHRPPTDQTIYTCPMHPEIEQDHPGDCPICGMRLEPKTGLAKDGEEDRETRALAFKFWIGLILTIPLLVLALGQMIPGLSVAHWLPTKVSQWIQLILATVIVFWSGDLFFLRAWRSVLNRSLNMFTLIGLGVGAAYLYSAIATLLPGLFPDSFKHEGEIDLYFESAAVITVLVLFGQWLEARARSQTGKAI